jgi:hypothetical protein
VFSCFRRRKLVIVRYGVLAALVRVRRRNALAFKAAIRSLATWGAGSEAIKRPEEKDHCHQADYDLKATSHSGFRIARYPPKLDSTYPYENAKSLPGM